MVNCTVTHKAEYETKRSHVNEITDAFCVYVAFVFLFLCARIRFFYYFQLLITKCTKQHSYLFPKLRGILC